MFDGLAVAVGGFALAVAGLGGVASASWRATWRSVPTIVVSVFAWVVGTILMRYGLEAMGVVE
jgi:hypothetical protein